TRDSFKNRLAVLGIMLAHAVRRLTRKERHCTLIFAESTAHLKWLPVALLLIFCYAIGKFAGITKGRHIDAVRPCSPNVQQNELQRASQCAVGAGHIAEHI